MKRLPLFVLLCAAFCQLSAQAPNDACNNAAVISNVQTLQMLTIDFTTATESLDASCETASHDNLDLWYSFVMPFDGKIKVSGISVVIKSVLFDQCSGTELGCVSGNGFLNGLTGGNTYLLRLGTASQYAAVKNVFIQAFTPPANDDCVNAIPILSIDTLQTIVLDNRGALEELDASCESAANDNLDLWYSFVMPFDGKIKLSGISVIIKTALYDQCGGTEIGCLGGAGFFENLMGGNTYLLRYASASLSAASNTFYIQAFNQPSNDDCVDAIAIPNIASIQSVLLDNRGAEESLDASCENSGDNNLDLWYSITMPFDGKLKVSGISVVKKIALYDQCGGTELACIGGNGFIENLLGGSSYILRYASASQNASNQTFYVQAFSVPAHDECSNALPISNLSSPQSISLDTSGATESLDASCENAADDNVDLWYQFSMPFDGKFGFSGVFGFNRISLYDSCGGAELGCQVGNGFFYGLSAGHTYALRYAAIAAQANTDQITLQAFPVAVNDACSNAINLSNLASPQSISLDTREATESLDASCENTADENLDLWYRFTMPFDGKLQISQVFGFNKLALFDSCGGSELACFSGNGFFDGLSNGTPYLLRYAAIASQADADQIEIQAFPPITNDECSNAFAIMGIDSLRIVNLDTRQASESLDASCEDPVDDNFDLWYQFTMPFEGEIALSKFMATSRLLLYDSCGSAERGCLSADGRFYGLQGGDRYILRYATPAQSAAADQFHIQAIAPPPHDQCEAAQPIDSIVLEQKIYLDIRQATARPQAFCRADSLDQLDLWYRFSMPFEGKVAISEANPTHYFSLWDTCGGTQLICFAGDSVITDLKADSTYFLRYASERSLAQADSFLIQAFETVGIDQALADEVLSLAIFPNPATKEVYFRLPQTFLGQAHLQVFDSAGKSVYQHKLSPALAGAKYLIPIASFPTGLYSLRLSSDSQLFTARFIKQ
ncbi:MAG: T9SS type A sorting domain-containing protein [Bacteroidota bacterium]